MPRATRLELAIFITGLTVSLTAGVVSYRVVGLYGDGPFASGYRRLRDPETGRSLLVHETVTAKGVVRRVIEGGSLAEVRLDTDRDGREEARVRMAGTTVTRVDLDVDRDGRIDRWEYYDAARKLVKVGFSLAGDGVLDAWAYRDPAGQLTKIEVSTRRDGVVDRWEYYEKGQLARVEEDTDRDGRVDRWSYYEDGILVRTARDFNGDGQPDPPPPALPVPVR